MSSRVQDYKYVLAAGVDRDVRLSGFTSLTLVSASGASPVKIILDNGSYQADFVPGDGLDDVDLSDLKLLSAVAQTVVLRVSRGYQRNGQTVNVNASATVQPANTCKAVADVTAAAGVKTLVIAANGDRKTALIKNLSTNTTSVRLGDNATVAANVGIELDPGETAALDTEAAIYCHNASGAAVVLAITELERI